MVLPPLIADTPVRVSGRHTIRGELHRRSAWRHRIPQCGGRTLRGGQSDKCRQHRCSLATGSLVHRACKRIGRRDSRSMAEQPGRRTMAPFTRCGGGNAANGGDYERATDPWVTFAPNGNAFQMALATQGASFAAGSVSAMLVSRSTDSGQTLEQPVNVDPRRRTFFNDKNTITADPTDANYVYAVWDRLAASGGGPSFFARTTDGGNTWEAARSIFDPGPKARRSATSSSYCRTER